VPLWFFGWLENSKFEIRNRRSGGIGQPSALSFADARRLGVEDSGFKVLMVTSEVVPFAKAGGLGDMVAALAAELSRQGHDVRVVLPRYYSVDIGRLRRVGGSLKVPLGDGEEWCAVYESRLPGTDVPVYFLDHQVLYGRDGIYGTRVEPSFPDNLRRFALLSRGAFELCGALGWYPDVMHAHDWPAAVVPVCLYAREKGGPFAETGSVLTIHNLNHQGVFPKKDFKHLPLAPELYASAGFKSSDGLNLLLAGIRNADILTTVSPTYADEIQTPEFGCGLDALLRSREPDLFGVLNGIDYEVWNPETDLHLAANYSHQEMSGKAANKRALQEVMGLEVDSDIPVFAMISRLVDQKGFGELCGPTHGSLWKICDELDLQFVILGTGDGWCEEELAVLAEKLPNLSVALEFNDPLAHLIEAGADFFLMPSVYEPCGLSQMYSLRYGTLPIVHRTGGLADTVENYDEETGDGTGFVFNTLTPRAIFDTVGWAVSTWYDRPQHISIMRERAMEVRFPWDESARRYAELYDWAVDRRLGRTPRT
jgi:starch synthase